MSAHFEYKASSSTAKSLVGALLALGAGFVFMFVGFVAVARTTSEPDSARLTRALAKNLREDLQICQKGSLQASGDGYRIRFRTLGHGTSPLEVVYEIDPASGGIVRTAANSSRILAKLDKPKFTNSDGLVQLSWKEPGGRVSLSWALNRYSCARQGAP